MCLSFPRSISVALPVVLSSSLLISRAFTHSSFPATSPSPSPGQALCNYLCSSLSCHVPGTPCSQGGRLRISMSPVWVPLELRQSFHKHSLSTYCKPSTSRIPFALSLSHTANQCTNINSAAIMPWPGAHTSPRTRFPHVPPLSVSVSHAQGFHASTTLSTAIS